MEQLEQLAPISYAESWDNVGLLVGREEKEVKKIMIALDASDSVVEQVVKQQADMLITHHPMIFTAMKRVTDTDFIGRRILALAGADVSYYAMHTNCDVCMMNDVAAKKIVLQTEDILETVVEDRKTGEKFGIGKVGVLKDIMSVSQLAGKVKEAFELENIRVTGDINVKVDRVAISTGSGKSMVKAAIKKGAKVLITGDMDHHTAKDALDQGLQIIDAGHYGTEHFMVEEIYHYLAEHFGKQVEIIMAKEEEPFLVL